MLLSVQRTQQPTINRSGEGDGQPGQESLDSGRRRLAKAGEGGWRQIEPLGGITSARGSTATGGTTTARGSTETGGTTMARGSRETGGTTMARGGMMMAHNDGDRRRDDSKGQQGNRQRNDSDGQHDEAVQRRRPAAGRRQRAA